jgi:hypothetical protein
MGHVGDLLLDDVLPDWDEEWLTLPRFLHRQLRLQALDRAIANELATHNTDGALALARRLLGREPQRESTNRLLASCHAAIGPREKVGRTAGPHSTRSL